MFRKRVKRVQKAVGVDSDGVIGPATLSAIENHVLGKTDATKPSKLFSLTLSTRGFEQLIEHEISSRAYYEKKLQRPIWPKGASGITIGIGYDLGYHQKYQIRRDWQAYADDKQIKLLESVAGLKGDKAEQALKKVRSIKIPFEAAAVVFSESTLPRYAEKSLKAYKGLDELRPDAQAAIVSLVYNRGTAMSGSKRKEMKAIQPLVKNKDYQGIANELTKMKRLWKGKGLQGLLKRRDDEARLVRDARTDYSWKDLVRV